MKKKWKCPKYLHKETKIKISWHQFVEVCVALHSPHEENTTLISFVYSFPSVCWWGVFYDTPSVTFHVKPQLQFPCQLHNGVHLKWGCWHFCMPPIVVIFSFNKEPQSCQGSKTLVWSINRWVSACFQRFKRAYHWREVKLPLPIFSMRLQLSASASVSEYSWGLSQCAF